MSLHPTNWTRSAALHGLAFRGLGYTAAIMLRDLGEKELPLVQPRPANGHRQYKAKPGNNQGQLIRHGMLAITPERTGYRITAKGRSWVSALIQKNLIDAAKEAAV